MVGLHQRSGGRELSYSFGLKLSKLAQRLSRLRASSRAAVAQEHRAPDRRRCLPFFPDFPSRPVRGGDSPSIQLNAVSAPAGARVGFTGRVAMAVVGTASITVACAERPVLSAVRAARFRPASPDTARRIGS